MFNRWDISVDFPTKLNEIFRCLRGEMYLDTYNLVWNEPWLNWLDTDRQTGKPTSASTCSIQKTVKDLFCLQSANGSVIFFTRVRRLAWWLATVSRELYSSRPSENVRVFEVSKPHNPLEKSIWGLESVPPTHGNVMHNGYMCRSRKCSPRCCFSQAWPIVMSPIIDGSGFVGRNCMPMVYAETEKSAQMT